MFTVRGAQKRVCVCVPAHLVQVVGGGEDAGGGGQRVALPEGARLLLLVHLGRGRRPRRRADLDRGRRARRRRDLLAHDHAVVHDVLAGPARLHVLQQVVGVLEAGRGRLLPGLLLPVEGLVLGRLRHRLRVQLVVVQLRGVHRGHAADRVAHRADRVQQLVVHVAPLVGRALVARVERHLLGVVDHGRDGCSGTLMSMVREAGRPVDGVHGAED